MQRASGSCRPREATQRNGHGEERPSMAGRWREQESRHGTSCSVQAAAEEG
jgi:hypothetical protein